MFHCWLLIQSPRIPLPISSFPVVQADYLKVRALVLDFTSVLRKFAAVMINHGNIIYSLYQTGVVGQTTLEVYTVRKMEPLEN